ncbi:MAG: hypothetical protein ACLUQ6_12925 [Alistipes onderdonkii]
MRALRRCARGFRAQRRERQLDVPLPRAMVSYASWACSTTDGRTPSRSLTRQGGNSYVDGVYYNAYGYFASVEKRFGGDRHNLALTILGAPDRARSAAGVDAGSLRPVE